MADLLTKYQKLATEFSKVRAQVSVLKKAVIDEQASNEDLKNKLRGSEQTTRKLEQEVEGVTFRNQQLESRVSVLQTEIEQLSAKKKKSPNHYQNNTPQLEILNEELSSKLNENVSLHIKLNQMEEQCKRDVEALKKKLQEAEDSLNQNQNKIKTSEAKCKCLEEEMESLKSELTSERSKVADLEGKVVQVESDLVAAQTSIQTQKNELEGQKDDLIKQLEESHQNSQEEREKYEKLQEQRTEELKRFKDEMESRDKQVTDKQNQLQSLTAKVTRNEHTQTDIINLSSNSTQTSPKETKSYSSQTLCASITSTSTQTIKFNTTTSQSTQTLNPSITKQPSDGALEDNEGLLNKQVQGLQNKLLQLESEKEHYSLQVKVLNAKCKQLLQKCQTQLSHEGAERNVQGSVEELPYGLKLSSDLGDIKVKEETGGDVKNEGQSTWDEERERITIQHYEVRLQSLVVKLQESQAIANHYTLESVALHQQLQYLTEQRDSLSKDYDVSKKDLQKLKDELNTTSSNYESQLSLMSDHLASINETMAAQKEEIDTLKYQLNLVGNSNNSNKNNSNHKPSTSTSKGMLKGLF